MKMIFERVLGLLLVDFIGIVLAEYPGGRQTPLQIIQRNGYQNENHYVTTEDGYILNVYRIPQGLNPKASKKVREPVLLLHGITSSAADWVVMGPDRGLAFLLADLGYDVWLMNHRGNTFSRNHTTLNPDQKDFWLYSFHEHGYYDIPAVVDYVLNKTGQPSLFYAGHSQGTSSVFVTLTTRPEYNKKFRMVAALSPEVFFENQQNQAIRIASLFIDDLTNFFEKASLYELVPNRVYGQMIYDFCAVRTPVRLNMCMTVLWVGCGYSAGQMGYDELSGMLTNWPAGASTRQIIHFGQLVNSKRFSHYDHGEEKNMEKYGQQTPPDYDLGIVTAPVALFHGDHDLMGSTVDVKRLFKELKNEKHLILIDDRTFNHVDVLVGKDVVEVLYSKMFDLMKRH